MKQGDQPLKGVKVLFLDPEDPRGVEVYKEIIEDAGGQVIVARSVDEAMSIVQTDGKFLSLIIYAMWMPTGEAFKTDINARKGYFTGKCFEAWARLPTGGNLTPEAMPLLLYSGWGHGWLERHDAKPRGKRDRTITKTDLNPQDFITLLYEMTR